MTDYKALCAELADELDAETGYTRRLDGQRITHPTVARARAALAEPEPEGPTDEEIMDVAREADLVYYMGQRLGFASPYVEGADITEEVLAFARAVLARWGNHLGSPDSSTQPS